MANQYTYNTYKNNKERILENIAIDPATSCWEWQLSRDTYGYGRLKLTTDGVGRFHLAHRLSYELFSRPSVKTEIPEGSLVLHRCDNPACVNPTHLFLGNHADNMSDMVSKGRQAHGSKNPASKVTEYDVAKIRHLWAEGKHKQAELAEMFGISSQQISSIVTWRSWAREGGATNEATN